ncbi:MAG TPA: pyridoxamine 5'-phosphate oxidase family protein [Stellaceae bacterium]|nr:pyridoxamine 5'-phosphate oxidase family protein [Stellaceae bacterium]
MSEGTVRRKDKEMPDAEAREMLARAQLAHFATVGASGDPYVVPNLFVYADGFIYLHTSTAGHFRRNVEHSARISVTVAEMGAIYPYGEFECDTTASYASVVVFGNIGIVPEPDAKAAFFDRFLAKYADPNWNRPKGFYPRLDQVTVYRITIERITGKKGPLPGPQGQWPAVNMTKSPGAVPPKFAR